LKIPEVVECHFITGGYSIFLKLYCLNNEHLMEVLSEIQSIRGVASTETQISLRETFQRAIPVSCLKD
jgi:Lrp/AsnC family transcriptional regulator for asnA, asnC and gidA